MEFDVILRPENLRLFWEGSLNSLSLLLVSLVVGGLLSWAAFSAYDTVLDGKDRRQAQDMARQVQSQLRAFAVRHGRLPCPDTSAAGTGLESLAGGVCGSGNRIGWFPYVSVGAGLPVAEYRARYAVYRRANATASLDADLAVARERNGDAPGQRHHQHGAACGEKQENTDRHQLEKA